MFNFKGRERGAVLVEYGAILFMLVLIFATISLSMQGFQDPKNYETAKKLVVEELEEEEVVIENLKWYFEQKTFLADAYTDGKQYKVEFTSERNLFLVTKVVDIKNIQEISRKNINVDNSIESEDDSSKKQE